MGSVDCKRQWNQTGFNLYPDSSFIRNQNQTMETFEKMEPMSAGQILDRTLKLYSRNWSLLLGISAVLTLPAAGLMIAINSFMQHALRNEDFQSMIIGVILFIFLFCVYSFLIYPWAQGASTFAISERYLNREVSIGQAIGFGWRRFGTLFNVSLSIGLRVGIGLILFIVPGIMWACAYIAAIPAVIIEGGKARDGIRRSRELAKGRRWSVFGILLTIILLSTILNLAFFAVIELSIGTSSFIGDLIYNTISQSVSVLLMPVGVIAATLLYYDFRIRKEGFDLEMLQQTMHAEFNQETEENSNSLNQDQGF